MRPVQRLSRRWTLSRELFSAVALLVVLGVAGTGQGRARDSHPDVIMFFLLVNVSGRAVRLKALVDGREVFVQEIQSTQAVRPEPQEVPSRGRQPTRELKVPLNTDAGRLEVEELNSGMRAEFDIRGFASRRAGFRITVEPRRIRLDQDYLPIR